MNQSWSLKGILALASIALGVWLCLPNLVDETASEKSWFAKLLPNTAVKLGLDLRGGTHLVLGIDLGRAVLSEVDNFARDLKLVAEKENISIRSVDRPYQSSQLQVVLASAGDASRFEKLLVDRFDALEVKDTNASENTYTLAMTAQRLTDYESQVITQALETLRNRLDQFGVAEPSIQAQGRDRIVVQLPGLDDPKRAKAILGKTAQLEFRIVDAESLTPENLVSLVEEAKKTLGEGAKPSDLNAFLKSKLPPSTEIFMKDEGDSGIEGQKRERPVLVSTIDRLSGNLLEDARVGADENGWPEVSMRFNPAGAGILDQLSSKNVGKQMAIVLDDKIYSDPVLQSRIPDGNARITLGSMKSRNEVLSEARDLALVLRTGALPAPVEILESRTVGPSLGQESIQKGLQAMLLGLFLVMGFIAIYYRFSGSVANGALLINLLFILAGLGLLHATLTLPGIAGILISLAMAIDANVLIYERIREELRGGKSPMSAIELGYDRASITIIDSNLTTMIAALILLEFGSGPIKGFAVTLIFGLIANYATALWFTRLFFDWWLKKTQPKTLSI